MKKPGRKPGFFYAGLPQPALVNGGFTKRR
jgi:hypothetical protein